MWQTVTQMLLTSTVLTVESVGGVKKQVSVMEILRFKTNMRKFAMPGCLDHNRRLECFFCLFGRIY